MERDTSFLSDVQQGVFETLCSLYPNFSHDALIDTVTSEVNYSHDIESAALLLNRCMDDLMNRNPLVDLTAQDFPQEQQISHRPGSEDVILAQTSNSINTSTLCVDTSKASEPGQPNPPSCSVASDLRSLEEVKDDERQSPSLLKECKGLDDVENNNDVIDLGDFEDVREEVICVPEESDDSVSLPEVSFVVDDDENLNLSSNDGSPLQGTKQLTDCKASRDFSTPLITGVSLTGSAKTVGNSRSIEQAEAPISINSDSEFISSILDLEHHHKRQEPGMRHFSNQNCVVKSEGPGNVSVLSHDIATCSSASSSGPVSLVGRSESVCTTYFSPNFDVKQKSESSSRTADVFNNLPCSSKSFVTSAEDHLPMSSSSRTNISKNGDQSVNLIDEDSVRPFTQIAHTKSQEESTSSISQTVTCASEKQVSTSLRGGQEMRPGHMHSADTKGKSLLPVSTYGSPVCNSRSTSSFVKASSLVGSSQEKGNCSQSQKQSLKVSKPAPCLLSNEKTKMAECHRSFSRPDFNGKIQPVFSKYISKDRGEKLTSKVPLRGNVDGQVNSSHFHESKLPRFEPSVTGLNVGVMAGNNRNINFGCALSSGSSSSASNASRPGGSISLNQTHSLVPLAEKHQQILSVTEKSSPTAMVISGHGPGVSLVNTSNPAVRTASTSSLTSAITTGTKQQSVLHPLNPGVQNIFPILNSSVVNNIPGTSKLPQTQHLKLQTSFTNNVPQRFGGFGQQPSQPVIARPIQIPADVQGFVPRNVALAQRPAGNAPDNRFPGLPNDFPVVNEEVTPPPACACQRMGQPCTCPFPGAGTFQETNKKDLSEMVARVVNLFPDASVEFVQSKLEVASQSVPDPVQWLCNLMIEEPYPRKPPPKVTTKPAPEDHGKKKVQNKYLQDWRNLPSGFCSREYSDQTRGVLASVYKMISMTSIDAVRRATRGRLSPALYVLDQVLQSEEFKTAQKNQRIVQSTSRNLNVVNLMVELPGERKDLPNGNKKETKIFQIKLNKKSRSFLPPVTSEEILSEIKDYQSHQMDKQLESDHQLALELNQKEYEQNQQGIECECCFTEYPFESMVQCFEMHLFCKECLRSYIKEAIYGQGKGSLSCMASGCSSTFPRDQLEEALPPDVLAKYDERCSEESVHQADLEDLVRCPNCDFAAILASELKAFMCLQCGKETCRKCQVDWAEHFGKKCEEVENKTEEELRTKYEEKLTEALIRTCHKCKASIVKENGCNKMTCRCGAKMCYICRKPDIDYNHFCRHVRDPNMKGCTKCNACCLWEVAEVVDEKSMSQIKDELRKEQDEKGIDTNKRAVGVPDHLLPGTSKKPRIT